MICTFDESINTCPNYDRVNQKCTGFFFCIQRFRYVVSILSEGYFRSIGLLLIYIQRQYKITNIMLENPC